MNSVSNNVLTEKSGFEAVKRGCGAFGEVGKIGGQLVDWLQGGEMTLNRVWENSACFTKPGARDKEVDNFQRQHQFIFPGQICICNKDGCNQDVASARKASGINVNAR